MKRLFGTKIESNLSGGEGERKKNQTHLIIMMSTLDANLSSLSLSLSLPPLSLLLLLLTTFPHLIMIVNPVFLLVLLLRLLSLKVRTKMMRIGGHELA